LFQNRPAIGFGLLFELHYSKTVSLTDVYFLMFNFFTCFIMCCVCILIINLLCCHFVFYMYLSTICHCVHLTCKNKRQFTYLLNVTNFLVLYRDNEPSVLRRCWLSSRKGIRPVKNGVVGCWHGYLSGARCRLAYGSASATATHCLLLQ